MMQVSAPARRAGTLDGVLIEEHGGRNYPAMPMSINFNLWFIDSAAHSGGVTHLPSAGRLPAVRAAPGAHPGAGQRRGGGVPHRGAARPPHRLGRRDGRLPHRREPATPRRRPPPSPSLPLAEPRRPPAGNCVNAPLWNISGVYTTGNQVKWERSANGNPGGPKSGDGVHLWRARWWTQGSEPGWTQQWEDLGRC